jgi:hypothetical protein
MDHLGSRELEVKRAGRVMLSRFAGVYLLAELPGIFSSIGGTYITTIIADVKAS